MNEFLVNRLILVVICCGSLTGCNDSKKLSSRDRAEAAFKEGDLTRARELSDEALRENPEDHRAYLIRGRSWLEDGKVELAIQDYSKAIRLDPTDAQPYYFRADAYGLLGKEDKAFADRRQAHLKDPIYKKAFVHDEEQLVAEFEIQRRIAQNEEEVLDASEIDDDEAAEDSTTTQLDLSENSYQDHRGSDRDSSSDDLQEPKSIADLLRDAQQRSRDELLNRDVAKTQTDLMDTEASRPNVPSATEEFASWKRQLMNFEQSQGEPLPPVLDGSPSQLDEELDIGRGSIKLSPSGPSTKDSPPGEEESAEPARTPFITPFQRTWNLSGGGSNSGPSASGLGYQPSRANAGLPSTGLNSARPSASGLNSTVQTFRPRTASRASNSALHGSNSGTGLWRRTPRRPPSANSTPTAPGPSAPRTFRRNYLLPQSGLNSSVPTGPRTTGIRSSTLP